MIHNYVLLALTLKNCGMNTFAFLMTFLESRERGGEGRKKKKRKDEFLYVENNVKLQNGRSRKLKKMVKDRWLPVPCHS